MDEAKPILAYAAPANIGAAEKRTVFTFAAPSPREQFILNMIAIVFCVIGGVFMIALGIRSKLDEEPNNDFLLLGTLFASLVVAIAVWRYREGKRIGQYGDDPVQFRVKDGVLFIHAPAPWGHRIRTVDVHNLKPCTIADAQTSMAGVRIFFIKVRRIGWLTSSWAVRVAVDDHDVLAREVADLNEAIKSAANAVVAERLTHATT
jgi:hypothetical protein